MLLYANNGLDWSILQDEATSTTRCTCLPYLPSLQEILHINKHEA